VAQRWRTCFGSTRLWVRIPPPRPSFLVLTGTVPDLLRTTSDLGVHMRVLLTSWGSRGDIEPLAALALRLRDLGAEVRACVPPDDDVAALFRPVCATSIPRR